jgi:hypothetical protein
MSYNQNSTFILILFQKSNIPSKKAYGFFKKKELNENSIKQANGSHIMRIKRHTHFGHTFLRVVGPSTRTRKAS